MRIENTQNAAASIKNVDAAANQRKQTDSAKQDKDAVFDSRIKDTLGKLPKIERNSADRIQRAKAMIAAGKLESSTNINAAAANILKFGF
ncbi:hypothetical protein STSP2_00027 [Anaerohalosphaera lusitana]|uniref:Uncharacterized protein n=1 Tax=Anaerohalosphaera lusitana TaxID=1936003 RepID=A0A1U9NG32_9BACT|nr:hypothetical protein [Anaerohalosphaera lusitana]AQT66889.1 hypothetical protein STSP2_00027 [Anaerohalosphaera lusitana]